MDFDRRAGLVEWLLYTYEECSSGTVPKKEMHSKYIQDVVVNGENLVTTKAVTLQLVVKKVFPKVKHQRMRQPGQRMYIYQGITRRADHDENDYNVNLQDICDIQDVKGMNFFKLPSSSPNLILGYQHNIKVNKLTVLTEVIIDPTGNIKMTTLGTSINPQSMFMGTSVAFTKSRVVAYLKAVTKLDFCTGFSYDYSSGINSNVTNELLMVNGSERRTYRSKKCLRVVSPASLKNCCKTCLKQNANTKFSVSVQNASQGALEPELSVSTPVDTPSNPESSITPDEANAQIFATLDNLFPGLGEKTAGLKLLIEAQVKNMHVTEHRSRRWDSRIIRLSLMLWGRSPKAYMDLRSSGLLILPERLLQYYKNCVEQKPGVQETMLHWMTAEADRINLPAIGREGGLILDEMSIQEDLQIEKREAACELKGFSDLGPASEAMDVLKSGKREAKLATHVLQLVFLGDSGFRFPFAHFPTTEASSSDLFYIIWQAIGALRDIEFKINYISMDGASTNRSFMKLHFKDSSAEGMREQRFTVKSIMPPNANVVFLMDPSHTFKKIRNNVLKSGKSSSHKRNLHVDGQCIHWSSWVDAFNWDRVTNSLRVHYKLTENHLFPDNTMKMRNHLAEEVLDSDMLYLMQSYQRSLNGAAEAKLLTSVIEFLLNTPVMIEFFRDSRPVFKMGDHRLEKLLRVHDWFVNWEAQIKHSLSQIPSGHKDEQERRKKHMMSDQTREDISSAVLGIIELCKIKLQRHYPGSVVPARVNTDVVENVFCQQRGIHHGNTTNPNYSSYCTGINAVLLGQSSTSRKRSSNCGPKTADPSPMSLNLTLRKTMKKRTLPRI